MVRVRVGFGLILATLVSGCWDNNAERARRDGECRGFELSGKSYRMFVPMGSSIEQDTTRRSVLIRPTPNGRLVRFLSLAPLAGATLPPPTESTTLANGLSVSYSIDDDIGGGSGGPEAELFGETLLDPQTPIIVVCHDQREGGANAAWCLDYLATLEPAAAPEACK